MSKKKLCICCHGTNKENAENILKNGFRAWTYFAQHLEDALGYGGSYVFEVCFETKKVSKHWQFMIRKRYSPKKIVSLKYYPKRRVIEENKKLRDKVFESN